MKYRLLGASGVSVSVISFGCMSLASTTRTESEKLIQQAVEKGITLFDTADLYDKGQNEAMVGAALKPVRNKIILASKVGNVWWADGSGLDWNPSKSHILKTVEESLRRLQTDRIDLYQLHGGTLDDPIDETIEAFEQLKKEGKILHYGISSIRPNVIREYIKRSNIISVMLQYSLLDRRPEETVLPLLEEHQKGVLVRGALAQGLLIDKSAKEYLNHTLETVQKVQAVVKTRTAGNYSAVQLAMNYVLSNPAVTSVVAGIRTRQQLAEILSAITPVPIADLQALSATIPALLYEAHR